ncbi:MAG TPA: C-type lectin domain-containing protein [Xanthomonadales bacterium]|nr:C-type lectin domain-containing protein [Xanthomonadales bacterium]
MIDAAIDAPDSRMLAECPVPPTNCSRIISACLPETSCYYRCTTNRDWDDAKVRCEQDGMGCLVTLNDANENSCLALTLDASMSTNRYWIGYRQTDTSNEPLAGWTWPCAGAVSSFTPSPPWGLPPPVNEPNDNNGNEDCAMVVNNFGHWNDAACSDQIDYVCEFPR